MQDLPLIPPHRAETCPLVHSTGLGDSLQVQNNAFCREMNGTVKISQIKIIESSQTITEGILCFLIRIIQYYST